MLKYLKDNGYKTALASSTSEGTVRRELGMAGLLDFFDFIIGGNNVTHSKPDPEIFLKAMAGLGVAPETSIVIEDSYNGVRAGHASGAFVVMVPDLLPPTDEILPLTDMVVESLTELLERIRRR